MRNDLLSSFVVIDAQSCCVAHKLSASLSLCDENLTLINLFETKLLCVLTAKSNVEVRIAITRDLLLYAGVVVKTANVVLSR